MSQQSGSPLPFSLLDELSCYFDTPDEPESVHLEIAVPGLLDEAAFRAAVLRVLASFPRAHSHRARQHPLDSSYSWEPVPALETDPVAYAEWSSAEELAMLRARFLASAPPLSTAPPLRLLLAAGSATDETCVLLSANHATFDGLSCLGLLREIADAYQEPASSAGPRAVPPKPEPAPGPSAFPPASPPQAVPTLTEAAARPPGPLPRQRRSLAAWPVSRVAAEPAADRAGYGFHILPALPASAVRPPTATVNDVLIAALIVTTGRWNAKHGRRARNIRITMPINVRPTDQERLTGNYARLASVSARWDAGLTDLGAILTSVTQQTRWAKAHPRPEVDLFSRLLVATRLPVAVKYLTMRLVLRLAGPLICDTTLVSNLGNVTVPPRFGSLTATRMAFSTPAHMPRGLSVGAISLGGQLHVCIRYRRALLTDDAAAVFAGMYRMVLDELTPTTEA
jgi:NRPS condensation-like uncharacterized protein